MEKYSEYAHTISEHRDFMRGIMIIICCVIVALIMLCAIAKYRKMLFITCASGIAIMILMYSVCIFPYSKDLSESAYEMYKGEFYVEKCYSVNRGGCYILIRPSETNKSIRYKVLCDVSLVENDTTYNGMFVVSKNSKCLVDIDF